MDDLIKISNDTLYLIGSKNLQKVFLIFFDEKEEYHFYAEKLDYKKFPSKKYLAYFMQETKRPNLKVINIDDLPAQKCHIIAEDLDSETSTFCIYKLKKDLICEQIFEEVPTIPDDFPIIV